MSTTISGGYQFVGFDDSGTGTAMNHDDQRRRLSVSRRRFSGYRHSDGHGNQSNGAQIRWLLFRDRDGDEHDDRQRRSRTSATDYGTGTATSTTIDSGCSRKSAYDYGTGTATSTTIDSGGYQYVGYSYGTGYGDERDDRRRRFSIRRLSDTGPGRRRARRSTAAALSTSVKMAGPERRRAPRSTAAALNTSARTSGPGTATSTTIDSGGYQYVGVAVRDGQGDEHDDRQRRLQFVGDDFGTGTATSTTIESGGVQIRRLSAPGPATATSTTIDGGGQVVSLLAIGGTGYATSTTIDSGGEQVVRRRRDGDRHDDLRRRPEEVQMDGVAKAPVIDGGTSSSNMAPRSRPGRSTFPRTPNWGTLDLTGEGTGYTLTGPDLRLYRHGRLGSRPATSSTSQALGLDGDYLSLEPGHRARERWRSMNERGTVLESMTLDGTYNQSQFTLQRHRRDRPDHLYRLLLPRHDRSPRRMGTQRWRI